MAKLEPPSYSDSQDFVDAPEDAARSTAAPGTAIQTTRKATANSHVTCILTPELNQHIINGFLLNRISLSEDTLAAEFNKDRVQCGWCQTWFPDQKRLDRHNKDFPSGCQKHERCFGHSDDVAHAMDHGHTRCFVRKCRSKFREQSGWSKDEILQHVKQKHGYESLYKKNQKDVQKGEDEEGDEDVEELDHEKQKKKEDEKKKKAQRKKVERNKEEKKVV